MKCSSIVLLACFAILFSISAFAQSSVIFREDFNNNRNKWALTDDINLVRKIENGKYHVENKDSSKCWYSSISNNSLAQDQDFEIEAAIQEIDGKGSYGIIWGSGDKSRHIFRVYTDDRRWNYQQRIDGTGYDVIVAKEKQVKGSPKTLIVKKRYNEIAFWVNGRELKQTARFDPFWGDHIGFIVCGAVTVEVENLLIKQIANSQLAASPSTPTPRNKPTSVLAQTPTSRPTARPTSAISEKRLALVIGNAAYPNAPLKNPEHDAKGITQALQRLGFEVITRINLSQEKMKREIDQFGDRLKGYDVGLFFYSGHGIQANGQNYLMPIDAEPDSENEVEYDCVKADRVLAQMEDANSKTNIMLLDACRNNPFERSWTRSSRGKGLTFINAPSGSFIAYATAPGTVAYDGAPDDIYSPYTAALLQHITTPNITINDLFIRVRQKVKQTTDSKQNPWESTSLMGNFYFNRQ